MNDATSTETFRTRDLYLASYLLTAGGTLKGAEWELRICYFVFVNPADCERLISLYWGGATGVIREYAASHRVLKDLLAGGRADRGIEAMGQEQARRR